MCNSRCPYEYSTGDCRLNGPTYPKDAHCFDDEETVEWVPGAGKFFKTPVTHTMAGILNTIVGETGGAT